ncbi:hypothetical protein C8J56DRAFT_340856 [Mycena floridula]|nr:hypothetical protein C8J56DRAFT_340856 [Mycena floridula]
MADKRLSQSEGALRRIRSVGDIPSSDPTSAPPFLLTISKGSDESNHEASGSTPPGSAPAAIQEHPLEPQIPEPPPSAVLPSPTAASPLMSQYVTVATPHRPEQMPPPRRHNRSVYSRTMAFFGYGRGASRARRSLVSLIWNTAWGVVQIIMIIALLAVSTHTASPTVPNHNEWVACERPLGAWSCLWIIRVVLACFLTYWGYLRDRETAARTDPETAQPRPSGTAIGAPIPAVTSSRPHVQPTSASSNTANANPDTPPLPHSLLFRRLSLFSSLFSLSWFLTAHILEYTSINTCRHSSPHLWWLVFGILCITYLMVLEVIILGFIVFIIAPIIFLVWNVFLMCIGRHPLQNPTMIKPEIGKLPKSVVDRIPLVMYIPPPPDAPADAPIKIPEAAYSYPPKPSSPVNPKRRFRFLKFKPKKPKTEGASESSETKEGKQVAVEGDPQTWEDHWEQDGYPFVILDGNRAACAICLLDFEEPKRVGVDSEKKAPEPPPAIKPAETSVQVITEESRAEDLRLQDVGEGAQPLRLLACGHVFHKPCVDPWLTDVSGRCPVCQRPVDIPDEKKKKKRRQNNSPP